MQRVTTAAECRKIAENARAASLRVALVPTMGALHEGHLSLVALARTHAPFVIATVFVNPTQFGPNEDLARYPRDLEGDAEKLRAAGASVLFAPEVTEIYPDGDETRVRVDALASRLCGPFRPGHFEGVATVVTKFFAIVGSAVAVFGEKDFQQLVILRRVARDLAFDVRVVGAPLVRDPDGLAMSSRNAYLTASERIRALSVSHGLALAARAFEGGERDSKALEAIAREAIARGLAASDSIEYVSVADESTLETPSRLDRAARLCVAVKVGRTRLIDNVRLVSDPREPGFKESVA